MHIRQSQRGITILEMVIALAAACIILAILIPTLLNARHASHLAQCKEHQRLLGKAWLAYTHDHEGAFPHVPLQPAWEWGGVRFSTIDETPRLDPARPLNPYVGEAAAEQDVFACPADTGITAPSGGVGTGPRSAYRAHGTSFRANSALLSAASPAAQHGKRWEQITIPPDKLVIMGDPVWFEVLENTGRNANWHGEAGAGNLLFGDGSVRFITVQPKNAPEVVFDP